MKYKMDFVQANQSIFNQFLILNVMINLRNEKNIHEQTGVRY